MQPTEIYLIKDSAAVEDATERLRNILDAKYEAATLHEVCESLNSSKQRQTTDVVRFVSYHARSPCP